MQIKINEAAKLTGVTVRTLHYYDQIGLLRPETVTDTGYRLYGEKDLERLSQILFFRELDFSLAQIKDMLDSPSFDRKEALRAQKGYISKDAATNTEDRDILVAGGNYLAKQIISPKGQSRAGRRVRPSAGRDGEPCRRQRKRWWIKPR